MAKHFKNWYQDELFPVLMDKNLERDDIHEERKDLLSAVHGEILEVGIGTGNNHPFYPSSVNRITAIDPFIREVYSDRIQISLYPYSCEDMLFSSNSFDSIVCTFCLCSVGSVDKTLHEMKRILKPGGKIFILEHGRAKNVIEQIMQNIANPLFNYWACGCNVNQEYLQ